MKKKLMNGGKEAGEDFFDEIEDADDEDEPIEMPLSAQETEDDNDAIDDWFYMSDMATSVDFIGLQDQVEFSDINNHKFYRND